MELTVETYIASRCRYSFSGKFAILVAAKLPFTIGDNGPIGDRRLRLAGERGGECRALLGFHQACRLPQHQAATRYTLATD